MKIDPAKQSAETEGTAEARIADEPEAEATTTDEPEAEATTTDEPEAEATTAVSGAEPLTIALPDGSESVSEAILSHRRMLTNPSEHGLVSAEEAEEVRETVDRLAAEVPDELRDDLADLEASVDELADGLDRQQRQIQELRKTVASLAEILGASVDFQTGEEA